MPYAFCEQIGKEIRDISDEIPFEIPESWEWVRLSSICTKLVDQTIIPKRQRKNPLLQYSMLSSTNINHNTLVELNKVRYLNKEIFEKFTYKKVSVGDVFHVSWFDDRKTWNVL